ncbi:MAG TPA: hypothetical protein PLQ45_11170, partial [Anaerohalosphaeraceae bacterium]|nr:hypothetical protein [Anaerohalosphaeraceae bacterium]
MKHVARIALLLTAAALTGCKQSPALTTCQNEKQNLQQELAQARQTIDQQNEQLASMKKKYEEVNQKALEITRTLMEKSTQFKNQAVEK